MLGRYQILKHLAHGGMAEVLLARSSGIEGFERHVVIKRIRAEQARDTDFVRMFLDEARLSAALHHQNIVQVHDIGQEQGEYFFAMEYVHGEDVRTLLRQVNGRKEQIPLEHVITIVAGAAAGLHHAHEQRGPDRKPLGIVHRDVSPSNLLIGFDGGVKVVDFGIAKAAARSAETKSGTLKGKVAYMSPEQCTGKPVDRRADVFALGIVLYELATVRRLFKGDVDFLVMTALVQGVIPPPSQFRADLPPALEAIILKALATKPEDRYPTADALRLALDAFAHKAGMSISPTRLGDYVKQLFGDRVEPWLVEEEVEVDLGIDFDGSASGVVATPEAAEALLLPVVTAGGDFAIVASKDSPIAKARNRAITGSPPVPGGPQAAALAKSLGWSASDKSPTTASGTPLAWTPQPIEAGSPSPAARSSRHRWIIGGIGAAAGILLVIAAIALSGRGGEGQRDEGSDVDRVPPAASSRPAPPPPGEPVTVAAPDAPPAEPTGAAPDAGVAEPVVTVAPDAGVAQPVVTQVKPNKPIKPNKPNKPSKPIKLDLDSPD